MAHYKDLSPCDYFRGFLPGRTPLAIGWLERGHAFPTGDPGYEVYERLGHFLWPGARQIRGSWPETLDEAIGLVDDRQAWRYAPQKREFILETDERAFEAFGLRYESAIGVWKVAEGERWFAPS
jgi:hypothetical protein